MINYTTTPSLRLATEDSSVAHQQPPASFQICWNAFILGTSLHTPIGTNGETLANSIRWTNPGLNRNQLEKDFTRYERANASTPLWGKEGYRNDKIKADMKKEYAEDLKHQVEELRRKKMEKNKTGKDQLGLNIGNNVREVPARRARQVNSSKAAFLAMRNDHGVKSDNKDNIEIKHAQSETMRRNSKIPFDVPAGIRRQAAPTSRVIPQVDSRPSSVTEKPGQIPVQKITSPERRISNRPIQVNRRHRSSEEDLRNEYQNQYQNRKRNRKAIKRSFSSDIATDVVAPQDANELYTDDVAMEQIQSLKFVQKMLVEERAARKRLQDQLERISSLAERNETTLRDRTAYLEKLRTQTP